MSQEEVRNVWQKDGILDPLEGCDWLEILQQIVHLSHFSNLYWGLLLFPRYSNPSQIFNQSFSSFMDGFLYRVKYSIFSYGASTSFQ